MKVVNILPMSDQRYNAGMKRLNNTFKFDASDVANFRLKVLQTGQKHGWQFACETFDISKATYFRWQKTYFTGRSKLTSLIPQSTRPQHLRQMKTDPRLTAFIQDMRQTYGNIGREKIKIYLDEYAQSLGIASLSPRTIGKIIQKNH